MSGEDYATAAEAAEFLGVSLATFYVYVGRYNLRSQGVTGRRDRLYWRQDLADLRVRRRKGKPVSEPPRGELRRESGLTLLTDRGPYYRGESAVDLAGSASLEQVAALLWNCEETIAFGSELPIIPAELADASARFQQLPWADRIALMLPILERANPKSFDLSGEGMARTGGGIIRWLVATLLGDASPHEEPVHIFVARRLKLDANNADIARRFLVLAADHGFEPGAYAVRAVAANGVTPWRSVMTGLLVSAGRRSAMGRHDAAQQLLHEILDGSDPAAPILRHLRDGREIGGFGSGVYGSHDPRAQAMIDALDEAIPDDPDFRRLKQAIEMVYDVKAIGPSFSLISLFFSRRIGLEYERSLFWAARAVGWIAHAIEQFDRGEAEHREGLYSGPLPKLEVNT